jgi:hypothetical protein
VPDVTRTPLLERTTMMARLGPLLQAERVADMIVTMIAMPRDMTFDRPMIAPRAAVQAGQARGRDD